MTRFTQKIVISASAAGLFTPEEYAARQREVQQQADSAAAADEERRGALIRAQALELQVAASSSPQRKFIYILPIQRKRGLREAALKKMSFDLDDEV
jgi:hypothetical protein